MNATIKNIKNAVLVAAVLLASACSHDTLDGRRDAPSNREVGVSFDVAVSASTSRLLGSAASWQHVTEMRIYVFRSLTGKTDESFVYYYPTVGSDPVPYITIAEFNNDQEWKDEVSGMENHRYAFSPYLESGYYYRFLAIGLDEGSAGVLDSYEIDFTGKNWTSAMMSIDGTTGAVSELFTGVGADESTPDIAKNYHVTPDTTVGIKGRIELKRAVAGVLLYLTNIPSEIAVGDATAAVGKVGVVAIGRSEQLAPVSRRLTVSTVLTTNPQLQRLALIDLATAQPDELNAYAAGSFVAPVSLYGVNSALAGIPADAAEQTSLYLAFYGADDTLLKLVPIKNARVPYDPDSDLITDHPDDPDYLVSENGCRYNLQANHIYCLGYYDDRKREPLDLSKALEKGEAEITVLGSYQVDVDIEM